MFMKFLDSFVIRFMGSMQLKKGVIVTAAFGKFMMCTV